jgi:hypothetical protein
MSERHDRPSGEDVDRATIHLRREGQRPSRALVRAGPRRASAPAPRALCSTPATPCSATARAQVRHLTRRRRRHADGSASRGRPATATVRRPEAEPSGRGSRAAHRRVHETAMASKTANLASELSSPDIPQRSPSSSLPRPPVTNVMVVAQQLAQALGPARALINRIPEDPEAAIQDLRRWFARQHPAERDRLLWQGFLEAGKTYGHLQGAIQVAREALTVERRALVQADVERSALAAHPLPHTVEEDATNAPFEARRRYQSLGIEHDARQAAIAELERLLPAPEQALSLLAEVTVRLLEAAVTIDRETFVRRVRESDELEHLRSRFERLRTMAHTHAAEIDEWSRRIGRPVRVPRVAFPWPPAALWDALLSAAVELPQLVWDDGSPAA